jgi:hypothetical protein
MPKFAARYYASSEWAFQSTAGSDTARFTSDRRFESNARSDTACLQVNEAWNQLQAGTQPVL